ncbi:MAG: hypothetical protein IJL74_04550 [Bacilli bacterium]|nr:hypothetical protein [Bacilli bacterium]
MDTKYFINRDENGKIRWIGIDSDNGFITKEITDRDNKPAYDYQLHAVNAKTNGEFFEVIGDDNAAEVSEAFFVGAREKVTKVQEADEKTKKKTMSKSLAALGIAGALLIVTTTGLALSDKAQAKAEKWFGKSKTQTGSSIEGETVAESELENKSVSELIDMLNDEEQEEAISRIVDTQDYFNEEAAPTVKQGDKQLYFTFDETVAAYIYANAKAVSSDKIASFFGKSKIMILNEETGEYEEMNKDLVSAKYLSFCNVLSYYYQLGATERSGVDGLFENEKEAKFFRDFEDLVLEYNRTHSDAVKAKIEERLLEIYLSGNVDSLSDKYQGASSIIATAMVPDLYLNKVIDKKTYEAIVEKNETITCQEIYSQIEKIINCKTEENGKELIIEKIAELQNLKTHDLDRNLSMEESLEGYRLSDLDQFVLGGVPGFAGSKTITKHFQTITKDRSEAVKKTSAAEVAAAEQKAQEQAGIPEKNKNEDDYWDGYMDGYNRAYDSVWNGGSGNVSVPSGSAKYVEGFKAGVSAGKAYAKEDLAKAKKDKENYKPKTHEEVVEETFVPENNTNNNSNSNTNNNSNSNTNNNSNSNTNNNSNNNNNNNSNTESQSEPVQESAPAQQSTPAPAPAATPHEEVVEETFVYENDDNVSWLLKEFTYENDYAVYESTAKVRVRA